jgi:class 3 adenylate cyclase
MVAFALEMLRLVTDNPSIFGQNIRFGLHTGKVLGCVIGTVVPQYTLIGCVKEAALCALVAGANKVAMTRGTRDALGVAPYWWISNLEVRIIFFFFF